MPFYCFGLRFGSLSTFSQKRLNPQALFIIFRVVSQKHAILLFQGKSRIFFDIFSKMPEITLFIIFRVVSQKHAILLFRDELWIFFDILSKIPEITLFIIFRVVSQKRAIMLFRVKFRIFFAIFFKNAQNHTFHNFPCG